MEEWQKDSCAAIHCCCATKCEADNSDTDGDVYRKLYYGCIERCSELQQELRKYSGALSKYRRIAELKASYLFCRTFMTGTGELQDMVLSGIDERVRYVTAKEHSIQWKEKGWAEKMAAAQQQVEAAYQRVETAEKVITNSTFVPLFFVCIFLSDLGKGFSQLQIAKYQEGLGLTE